MLNHFIQSSSEINYKFSNPDVICLKRNAIWMFKVGEGTVKVAVMLLGWDVIKYIQPNWKNERICYWKLLGMILVWSSGGANSWIEIGTLMTNLIWLYFYACHCFIENSVVYWYKYSGIICGIAAHVHPFIT